MAEGSGQHELEISVTLDLSKAREQADAFRAEQQAKPINFTGTFAGGGGTGGGGIGTPAEASRIDQAINNARTEVDRRRALTPSAGDDAVRVAAMREAGVVSPMSTAAAEAYIAQQRLGNVPPIRPSQVNAADDIVVQSMAARGGARAAGGAVTEAEKLVDRESTRQAIAGSGRMSEGTEAAALGAGRRGGNFMSRFALLFATREIAKGAEEMYGASWQAVTASSFAESQRAGVARMQGAVNFGSGAAALGGLMLGGPIGAIVAGLGAQAIGGTLVDRENAKNSITQQLIQSREGLYAAQLQSRNIAATQNAMITGGTSAAAIEARRAGLRNEVNSLNNQWVENEFLISRLPSQVRIGSPEDRQRQALLNRTDTINQQRVNATQTANIDIARLDAERNISGFELATGIVGNQRAILRGGGPLSREEERAEAVARFQAEGERISLSQGPTLGAAFTRTSIERFTAEQNREAGLTRGQYGAEIGAAAFAGRGDSFGSSLYQLIGQNQKLVAEAKPDDRNLAEQLASSRVNALIQGQRRDNWVATQRFEADAEASRAQARGDNLEARLIQIRASRDAALSSPILSNPILNFLGINTGIRAGINNAANAAIELERFRDQQRDESLFIQRDVTGLQAQGRPFGAQIEQIAREAQRRSRDESGDAKDAILQTGVNQEMELRRQLLFGGRPEEITSGTFKPGAGEGSPQIEKQTDLLQQIFDAIKGLSSDSN